MSRTRIRHPEDLATPFVLGDGDTLHVAPAGVLHATGRQSAVRLTGGTAHVVNDGTLAGGSGSAVDGYLFGAVAMRIDNAGTIAGSTFGIALASDAGATGVVRIRNTGAIGASTYAAVDVSLLHVDRVAFNNTGTLNASAPGTPAAPLAYAGQAGRDVVHNAGTITGMVSLGGGDDVFHDIGRPGSRPLVVFGEDGNDRITGGSGADLIVGGAGRDVLRGGAGADIFAFTAPTDSAADLRHADRIADFDLRAGDVIDLSRIDAVPGAPGDQAFTFVGSAVFTGVAGELRYDPTADGAILFADLDGDARADFTLVVHGQVVLADHLAALL